MAELGTLSLYIALALAAYSMVTSFLGAKNKSPDLAESGKRAAYLTLLALFVAVICLVSAFVRHDFQIQYVAEHSNRAMNPMYTWVAFYSGNEGSLLFIGFVMSLVANLAILFSPHSIRKSLPYTTSILMFILTFFVFVNIFFANPFQLLSFVPSDGNGINPLLTHPGMFMHPPMLMTGLITTSIPFAIAMGALMSGQVGDEWADAGRMWGIIAWAVLGTGLLLGAWWAYTILGWGGYWGWDPIENAGLMPWLALTAFIHSIMVQKHRGMFRMWNIVLVIVAFGLAQFGMFLNRGGPVVSVHSFASSTLGWIFLAFMGITMVAAFSVFFYRYDNMKSARTLESTLSREVAFLVNNVLLLVIAFATMWGAIFPLITELFRGQTVSIGKPFYNQINGPLFLGLIFLMGVGPLLPWRQASLKTLRNAMLLPGIVAGLVVILLAVLGVREGYPLAAFGLCAGVGASIIREWSRGTRTLSKRGINPAKAFFTLLFSNRPRYGGYIVHIAILMLAIGIAGSSFYNVQQDVTLAEGQSAQVGNYSIKYVGSNSVTYSDKTQTNANLQVSQNGKNLGTYSPWTAYYPSFDMSATRAAIRSTPLEDLYMINSQVLSDGSVMLRIIINPLVMWIWIAGPVLILGTIIALWPQRRLSRTQRLTNESIVAEASELKTTRKS